MKLTVLVDNYTYIDMYYLGEPALSFYLEDEEEKILFDTGYSDAFLKNAPLVILDEATSALDNKSEAVVQQAIDNLMKDRTVIVIAHRLSTVRHADKIVVVNYGKIAETGSHDELVKNPQSIYAALYQAQLK